VHTQQESNPAAATAAATAAAAAAAADAIESFRGAREESLTTPIYKP